MLCIENHILEDFLRERGAEVIDNMAIDLTFERQRELYQAEIKKEKKHAKKEKKRADKLQRQLDAIKLQYGIKQ